MYDDTLFFREWEDVASGDPWQPESADRYNAVNALLRNGYPLPENSAPRRTPGGCLTGVNNTNALIPVGCAVVPVTPLLTGTAFSDEPVAGVTRSSFGTSGIWGITLEPIPANGFGTVLLAGVVMAEQISGTAAAFVTAGENGSLLYASSGRAEVLKCNSSGKALLLLGGGGGSSGEYNGMFKIIRGSDTLFKVVDGQNPNSGIAGYTDFGPVNSVSINQTGSVWLKCRFTGTAGTPMTDATCEMSIVSSEPPDSCGKVLLGTTSQIAAGQYQISQWWRNNAVYWRTWYML